METPDGVLADPQQIIADLRHQLAERTAEQEALAEVLQVINSSPGELAPVFETILGQATRLCDAAFGVVWTYDRTAKRNRPGVVHRAPAALAEFLRGDYRAARSDILNVLGSASFLHILDAAESDGYRMGANLQRRALVDLGGVRTALAVPLRRHDTVLAIYRKEVRAFSEKQIALLQNFAAHAVIAMENTRLLIETREALEQQTATAEVLGVINSSPGDLAPVFDAMLTKAVGLCEADQGLLRTFDGKSFPLVAIYGRDPRIIEQVKQLGPICVFGLLNPMVRGERIVHVAREIVVVFCDLRGYTAFTETAEPEEVLDFLREYHGALGPLVSQFEGTLDQFSGDGIMVFFNDPVPIPDPAERAVNMAVAMREAAGSLIAAWRRRGRELGFGAGIAQGYATLGRIGFSERSGYTAIGTVCNVAARLCGEAKDGQILLSQRVNVALSGGVATEQVGALALKGLSQPIVAYNIPLVGSQVAFRVIEGGPPRG
jgi:class 3 adenylate cyclase